MTSRIFRRIWILLAVLVSLYAGLLAALFVIMHQPPDRFGRVMAKVPGPMFRIIPFRQMWMVARAGELKVGDRAPDFTLRTSDRKGVVQLSSFRDKQPVVLVFGSYT
jgi:hypothetical protein